MARDDCVSLLPGTLGTLGAHNKHSVRGSRVAVKGGGTRIVTALFVVAGEGTAKRGLRPTTPGRGKYRPRDAHCGHKNFCTRI